MTTQATILERFAQRIAARYPAGERAGDLGSLLSPTASASDACSTIDQVALTALLERDAELRLAVTRVLQHPRFGGIKFRQLTETNVRALLESELGLLSGLLYGFTLSAEILATVDTTELPRYWLRTLWRSVGSRLAERSLATAGSMAMDEANVLGDTLFPAAMLLETGKLVLLAELKQTYIRFVNEARDLGHDLCQLEVDSLGFDHRILTTRVLALWSIPSEIVRCVEEFAQATCPLSHSDQDPGWAGLPRRMKILLAADCLAELIDGGRQELAEQLVHLAAETFGWDLEELERWISQTAEPVRHLANCFGIELSEPATISAKLSNAWSARQTRARTQQFTATDLLADRSSVRRAGAFVTEPQSVDSEMAGFTPRSSSGVAAAFAAGPGRGVEGEGQRPFAWNQEADSETRDNPRGFEKSVTGIKAVSGSGELGRSPGPGGKPIGWERSGPRETWSDWLEDPVLQGQVAVAVEVSRAALKPLSIILLQIDRYESLMFGSTLDELDQLHQSLTDGIGRISRLAGGRVVELGDARMGVLLPGLDRTAANRCGQEMLRAVRQWSSSRLQKGKTGLTLSLGCAATDMPARNLQAKTLIEAAARCLDSVQLASGNGLKSIDIYY